MSLSVSEFGNLFEAVELATTLKKLQFQQIGQDEVAAHENARTFFQHARGFVLRTLNELHTTVFTPPDPGPLAPPDGNVH